MHLNSRFSQMGKVQYTQSFKENLAGGSLMETSLWEEVSRGQAYEDI